MENQIESDMELRDSLNRDLRVRKQVEDLFYIGILLHSTRISILFFIFRFADCGFLVRKRLLAGGCGRRL